jgi:hypothetical protein
MVGEIVRDDWGDQIHICRVEKHLIASGGMDECGSGEDDPLDDSPEDTAAFNSIAHMFYFVKLRIRFWVHSVLL